MPFGLRFKRTRRYDISTKNVFMVEVQMLDNSFVECTLTSDSTGHECLDAIAQKIELQEMQYFGLRYVTKKIQFRWVDLTKPLKKQLEKYAQTSHAARLPRLYFGVIFYVSNAHKIIDDVARYQYYLQLKNDIVDGRLPLNVDQVIRLAAYSLQVEFSDYEVDRPAADYFTDNVVFPKNLTKDEGILSELMNEVLQAYMGLQSVHPVRAEIEYMKEIQMMDGYGMEYYVAKDEKGKELYLGTSYVGIFARYLDGQPPIYYKWTEVARLSQSKKTFEIDTSKSSVQYSMEDSDTAKYLKRMCLLQQKFYKSKKTMISGSLSDLTDYNETEILHKHPDERAPTGALSSWFLLFALDMVFKENINYKDLQQAALSSPADIPIDQLTQSQSSLSSLKYADQKYEQDSRSASVNIEDYSNPTRSQQSLNVSGHDLSANLQQIEVHHESTDPHQERRSSVQYIQQYHHHQQQQQHQQQQHPHQPPQQTQNTTGMTAQDPKSDMTYASRLAALPAYRHTPDYETVMRRKMSPSQQTHIPIHNNPQIHDINQNIANTHIYAQSEEGLAYSQPEISSQSHLSQGYRHEEHYQVGSQIRNYPQSVSMYTNMFPEQANFVQYRISDRQTNLVMQPTYSSPELNTQGLPQGFPTDKYFNVNEAYNMYHYKPPPPYPRASNSTPDLAAQTSRSKVMDSPNLVSRKNLGDSVLGNLTNIDNSVENISHAIPEIVQLSENTVQTETGVREVEVDSSHQDDASSDHSNSTFHIKETDSETEETFVRAIPQRQSSKTRVSVRFVAPNKAPPPSASKDVATQRESFRRMMIARSGSFTPGVLRENSARANFSNRSLRGNRGDSKIESVSGISENIPEIDRPTNKHSHPTADPSRDPVKENVIKVLDTVTKQTFIASTDSSELNVTSLKESSFSSSGREVMRSQSDANKNTNKVTVIHEKAVSLDSSSERQQLLDKLKSTEIPTTISENERLVSSREKLVDYEDSDESDQEESSGSPIGPLKMAAMNGLAMSRPMVLALMNDETRAPKDERRKWLEKKLSENLVFKEYEGTAKRYAEYECNVAKLPENTQRNRFKDVLPYDATRVKLNPRKDNSSGYVNASHIKLSVGNRVWWYIATQAPMDNTAQDFWQMVWEQEVEVIAMLTALAELGRPKCYSYWPQDPGAENKIIFGDYEVTLLFTNDSLCYITNRICLYHRGSKKEKQVWHLQYTDWPDHGCPEDMYGFLGFLDEVESVQRLAESEEGSGKKSPVVVHCSAGVGRTGVVILTQVMKWCLEHNHDIDLPKALGMIRQQRMLMVQTLGQYNFIHKTLIQYLKNTRLI